MTNNHINETNNKLINLMEEKIKYLTIIDKTKDNNLLNQINSKIRKIDQDIEKILLNKIVNKKQNDNTNYQKIFSKFQISKIEGNDDIKSRHGSNNNWPPNHSYYVNPYFNKNLNSHNYYTTTPLSHSNYQNNPLSHSHFKNNNLINNSNWTNSSYLNSNTHNKSSTIYFNSNENNEILFPGNLTNYPYYLNNNTYSAHSHVSNPIYNNCTLHGIFNCAICGGEEYSFLVDYEKDREINQYAPSYDEVWKEAEVYDWKLDPNNKHAVQNSLNVLEDEIPFSNEYYFNYLPLTQQILQNADWLVNPFNSRNIDHKMNKDSNIAFINFDILSKRIMETDPDIINLNNIKNQVFKECDQIKNDINTLRGSPNEIKEIIDKFCIKKKSISNDLEEKQQLIFNDIIKNINKTIKTYLDSSNNKLEFILDSRKIYLNDPNSKIIDLTDELFEAIKKN